MSLLVCFQQMDSTNIILTTRIYVYCFYSGVNVFRVLNTLKIQFSLSTLSLSSSLNLRMSVVDTVSLVEVKLQCRVLAVFIRI